MLRDKYLEFDCDFGLQIEDYLTDYLCGKIQINQETKTKFTMQPHLINSLVENLEKYPTMRTRKVDYVMQSEYRSGGQHSFALD
jgi:hypothetical protein